MKANGKQLSFLAKQTLENWILLSLLPSPIADLNWTCSPHAGARATGPKCFSLHQKNGWANGAGPNWNSTHTPSRAPTPSLAKRRWRRVVCSDTPGKAQSAPHLPRDQSLQRPVGQKLGSQAACRGGQGTVNAHLPPPPAACPLAAPRCPP